MSILIFSLFTVLFPVPFFSCSRPMTMAMEDISGKPNRLLTGIGVSLALGAVESIKVKILSLFIPGTLI